MNLARLLARGTEAGADNPALYVGERLHSRYGELQDRVTRLAAWLRRQDGLNDGERVALLMGNSPDYLEWLFACWWAGLAAVPINARLHPRELAYILADSDARLCVTDATLAETARAAAKDHALPCTVGADVDIGGLEGLPMADPPAEELAWLFYTSGTTGKPKGACLSHRNLLTMVLCFLADIDSLDPGARWIHAAPISHGSGLYGLAAVARGAACVIPASGGFDVDEMCSLLGAHSGACGFFVPTMLTRLLASPAFATVPKQNIRTLVYGGGPMYLEDAQALGAALPGKLVQIYGQGESPMTITVLSRRDHEDRSHPAHRNRLCSVGRAQSAVEIRIVDNRGASLPAGEIGEVAVRGDTVMRGYWNNAAATAETLRGGWLMTGDLGALDTEGYLTLYDRSKDLIISAGQNIYPREIEDVLLIHPQVEAAAVVGRADREWGESAVAFVVPHPAAAADLVTQLDALCLARLARYKRPREYRLVAELPLSAVGKVLKSALREQLRNPAEDTP